MRNRMLVPAAVFAFAGVLGYVAWLRREGGRLERATWTEVPDPPVRRASDRAGAADPPAAGAAGPNAAGGGPAGPIVTEPA